MLWIAQIKESQICRIDRRNFRYFLLHYVPIIKIGLLEKKVLLICRNLLYYIPWINFLLYWHQSIGKVVKNYWLEIWFIGWLSESWVRWRLSELLEGRTSYRLMFGDVKKAIIVNSRKYLAVFILRIATLLLRTRREFIFLIIENLIQL